jgi:hypothetical protein
MFCFAIHRRRAQRLEDIGIAHSSTAPFSTTGGFGCHSYIPRDYRTTDKILDTDELNVCETLYSSDGAFSAQVTGTFTCTQTRLF